MVMVAVRWVAWVAVTGMVRWRMQPQSARQYGMCGDMCGGRVRGDIVCIVTTAQ